MRHCSLRYTEYSCVTVLYYFSLYLFINLCSTIYIYTCGYTYSCYIIYTIYMRVCVSINNNTSQWLDYLLNGCLQ